MKTGTKRFLTGILAAVSMTAALPFPVSAEEYQFQGASVAEFYPSKSYESAYGSVYCYGGVNAVDSVYPDLPFGVVSNTLIGAMEKAPLFGQTPDYTADGPAIRYGFSDAQPGEIHEISFADTSFAATAQAVYQPTAYTSTAGMVQSDGSIGTVSIPSLKISMKVWEDETNESMAKGLGHYSSTSGWDGNVGVCGHNRGARYVIGGIKDLQYGDTITYETIYGTRTYTVSYIGTISNTDWSQLQATADNRITITTCLADQPDFRVCVQAVEKII